MSKTFLDAFDAYVECQLYVQNKRLAVYGLPIMQATTVTDVSWRIKSFGICIILSK